VIRLVAALQGEALVEGAAPPLRPAIRSGAAAREDAGLDPVGLWPAEAHHTSQ